MSEAEVVDAIVEPDTGQELEPVAPAPAPVLAVTPQVKASELVERLDMIREAQDKAMVKDVDYGVIPGTSKPTLLKPGSEKLSVLFQLDVQLANEKSWGPGEHLTVVSRATVFHAPTGARLGYGEGVCTTKERKYAYRKQERTCPSCGAQAIIKGKAEYGGGWVCWKKKDGCGSSFAEDAEAIVSQEVGDIDNPDLPDLWNTVVKMAEKRARVDAVLAVTGASALFTQDAEDLGGSEPPSGSEDTPSDPPARTQSHGRDVPSVGQLNFLEQLLEEAKVSPANQALVIAWASENLKRANCSKTIEELKSKDLARVATAQSYLLKKAGEWAASQPDCPPDVEGLPSEPPEAGGEIGG